MDLILVVAAALLAWYSGSTAWKTASWRALFPPAIASVGFGLWALQHGPVSQPLGGDVDPGAIYIRVAFLFSLIVLMMTVAIVIAARRARRRAE